MSDVAITVELQATVIRRGAKPEVFGWAVKIPFNDDPAQTAATITDACKRLRDETQGKLKP